jgi:DNA invertase Pin-like site-specific DNA recombinase
VPAYVDTISGTTTQRPGMDALLRFVEAHGVDVVLAYSVDRISRNGRTMDALEEPIADLGARLEFAIEHYEAGDEGELARDAAAHQAKAENITRSRRTKRGKLEKAMAGHYVGGGRAPFGYALDDTVPGGLAVDAAQAETVRTIFRLYVEDGFSIREITRELTQRRLVNWSGRVEWGKSSVRRILTNETYAGTAYYRKSRRIGRYGQKEQVMAPRDEWVPISVAPIVDEATWSATQERLMVNAKELRKRPARFYLLSGLLYCELCGRPYTAQTVPAGHHKRATDGVTYRHRKSEGHCQNRHISARRLEPVVWGAVVDVLTNRELLREGYNNAHGAGDEQRTAILGELERLETAQGKHTTQVEKLLDTYLDGELMTKAQYLERRKRLDDELERISSQMAALRDELAGHQAPPPLATLEAFADEIATGLQGEQTPTDIKRWLMNLDARVLVGEGDAVVVELLGGAISQSTITP